MSEVFTDDVRNSENDSHSESENTPLQMAARTTATAKDVGKKKKTKRVSKTAELQNRVDGLENRLDKKFDLLYQLVAGRADAMNAASSSTHVSQSGGQATQNRENLDNGPSGARRPLENLDNGPTGARRPILSLSPNLDEDLGSPNIEFDARSELSLHPDVREKTDLLGLCSDDDSISQSGKSPAHDISTKSKKSDRFSQYIVSSTATTCTASSNESRKESTVESVKVDNSNKSNSLNVLGKLFKEDVPNENSDTSHGLLIDEAQKRILEMSWRSKFPNRLSCYKEEYTQCFPVHNDSVDILQVPSLDDMLESIFSAIHGQKAVKWGKFNQLCTQPLKQIERLAYQGQVASRMGIISICYLQQVLGTLLNKLESENVSSETVQLVKDIFAISMKSLDQMGRSGAFHHMIRRKGAASDAGFNNIKGVQEKVLYLPLSGDGVFGQGLKDKLEKRKEDKAQVDSLLPELNPHKKRKSDFNNNHDSWPNKAGKFNDNANSGYTNDNRRGGRGGYNKFSSSSSSRIPSSGRDKDKDGSGRNRDKKSGSFGNSFRIPKKSS